MRKLIAAVMISLDGVIQAPGGPGEDRSSGFALGGWAWPYASEGEAMDGLFTRPFALVLGRHTYDIFAGYWPQVASDAPHGAIADAFNVADLLAVRLVRDATGRVTGDIDGVPSFREGKITRVEQWLADQGHQLSDFDRVSFYSDSPNDLPLLERVNDPVATNPSPALEEVARERGWRVLRLFA